MFGIKNDCIFGIYDIVEFRVVKETETKYRKRTI